MPKAKTTPKRPNRTPYTPSPFAVQARLSIADARARAARMLTAASYEQTSAQIAESIQDAITDLIHLYTWENTGGALPVEDMLAQADRNSEGEQKDADI